MLFAAIPGVAVAVVALGQAFGGGTAAQQMQATAGLLPREASSFLAEQLRAVSSVSRLHLGAGLVAALWGARAAASTLVSVLNIAYREQEQRRFLRYHVTILWLTLWLCLFGLAALALITTVPLVTAKIQLASTTALALNFGRWPALAALMALGLAAIYRFGPSRRGPKWRWVSVGALLATVLWLAGSASFSAYVTRFASYDETFGALGAIMLLMTWFYLTAFSILLGAEINAEVERQTARDTTRGPERPIGQRQARMADTLGEAVRPRGGISDDAVSS